MSGSIRADRAAVRDLLVTLLVAGVPAVGGRVWRSRQWPIQPEAGPTLQELPAVLVYATPERKRREHVRASVDKLFRVTCDFTVIARAYPPPGPLPPEVRLEALLEQLAAAIEAVVLTAPALNGWAGAIEDIAEVRTDLVLEREGGTLAGAAVLTFSLEWTEPWSVPEPPTCDDPSITLAHQPPA